MSRAVSTVRTPYDGVLLVCGKCSKKLGAEGKALRKTLKHAVKEHLGKGQVRVVKTSCFDVCPKGAVTIASAGKQSPLTIAVAQPDAAPEEILAVLGLTAPNR